MRGRKHATELLYVSWSDWKQKGRMRTPWLFFIENTTNGDFLTLHLGFDSFHF